MECEERVQERPDRQQCDVGVCPEHRQEPNTENGSQRHRRHNSCSAYKCHRGKINLSCTNG